MKNHFKAVLTALAALCLIAGARAADVTGKWKGEVDTQIGHSKYTFDLKVDGEKVTGKALRERDDTKTETEIKEGKLTGDDLSFVEIVSNQDQEIRIEYKGKVAGDEIKFTRKVGDFGSAEFTAKREKDGGAAAMDMHAGMAMGGIAGKWQSEFETQVGHLKYWFDLKEDGGKITGKISRQLEDQKAEVDVKNGKLSGSDVTFTEMLKIPDQDDIAIEYKGKLSGDEMKLTRKVGDFGTTDIVAKRMK